MQPEIRSTGQDLIVCLGFLITRRAARASWKSGNKEGEKFFGNGKCEPIANFSATMVTSQWRERREVWREKRKVRVFGKGKCKLIANCANFWQRERVSSSPILARQWWRHFCLSLYLSLSLSHRMYLTHNLGSASALPIIWKIMSRKTCKLCLLGIVKSSIKPRLNICVRIFFKGGLNSNVWKPVKAVWAHVQLYECYRIVCWQ